MKVCSTDGCERKHVARGLCSTHYNQQHQPNRHDSQRRTVACVMCGTVVERSSSRKHLPTCSYKCRRDLSCGISELIPKDHPARWFGRKTDIFHKRCRVCGDPFVTPYESKAYCADRCATRARDGRRPPRLRGYRKHLMTVLLRDNWTCWLCGEHIDSSCAWPHPMSASLDHLIPQSLGGTHDPDNLGAAHLACNSLRGASMILAS